MGSKLTLLLFSSLVLNGCLPKSSFKEKSETITEDPDDDSEQPDTSLGISSSTISPTGNLSSPSSSYYPTIKGNVANDIDRIFIYTRRNCPDNAIAVEKDGSALSSGVDPSDFESNGVELDLSLTPKNVETKIYLKSRRTASNGNVSFSPCTQVYTYVHNLNAPISFSSLSVNSGTNWLSENPPAASKVNNPKIKLEVNDELITNVEIYKGACSGTVVSHPVSVWENTGAIFLMSEGDNAIYAKGTGANGYVSPCKEIFNYSLDTTAPSITGVVNHKYLATSTDALSFGWNNATDSGSGFSHYLYSIGTSAGAMNKVDWTRIDTVSALDISDSALEPNTTYYLNIKAVDNLGNISASPLSSGPWKIFAEIADMPKLEVLSPIKTSSSANVKVINRDITITGKCINKADGNDILVSYPDATKASGPTSTACNNSSGTFSVNIQLLGAQGSKQVRLEQKSGTASNQKQSISITFDFQPLSPYSKQISASDDHSCAIQKNNVYCWGFGNNGKLGDADTATNVTPNYVRRPLLSEAVSLVQVTTGREHSCSIDSNNLTYCWGSNTYKQLGHSPKNNVATPASTNSPIRVTDEEGNPFANFVQISAGYYHNCAIKDDAGQSGDEKVYCWGYNAHGELGDTAATGSNLVPQIVTIPGTPVQVSSGGYHSCALNSLGDIYCWGYNGNGMLGIGNTTNSSEPVIVDPRDMARVGSEEVFTYVSAGGFQTCGITNNYRVYCWGYNGAGAHGTSTTAQTLLPIDYAISATKFVKVSTNAVFNAANQQNTCAVSDQGRIYCWGQNNYGQLGVNNLTDNLRPDEVTLEPFISGTPVFSSIFSFVNSVLKEIPTSVERWIDVSVGGYHTCGRTNKGNNYCWGNNTNRLGKANVADDNKDVPQLITSYPDIPSAN